MMNIIIVHAAGFEGICTAEPSANGASAMMMHMIYIKRENGRLTMQPKCKVCNRQYGWTFHSSRTLKCDCGNVQLIDTGGVSIVEAGGIFVFLACVASWVLWLL